VGRRRGAEGRPGIVRRSRAVVSRSFPRRALLALAIGALAATASGAQDSLGRREDIGPHQYRPMRGRILIEMGDLHALSIAAWFRHVGGRRFLLTPTVEAEQQLFVEADRQRNVKRLLWIQVEARLHDAAGTDIGSVQRLPHRRGRRLPHPGERDPHAPDLPAGGPGAARGDDHLRGGRRDAASPVNGAGILRRGCAVARRAFNPRSIATRRSPRVARS
jgi:hypothetical protein